MVLSMNILFNDWNIALWLQPYTFLEQLRNQVNIVHASEVEKAVDAVLLATIFLIWLVPNPVVAAFAA